MTGRQDGAALLGYLSGIAAAQGLPLRTVIDETVDLWRRAGTWTAARQAEIDHVEQWLAANPDQGEVRSRPAPTRPNHPGMTAIARAAWSPYAHATDAERLAAICEVLTSHGYGQHHFGGAV